jgi:hypothetical protein
MLYIGVYAPHQHDPREAFSGDYKALSSHDMTGF